MKSRRECRRNERRLFIAAFVETTLSVTCRVLAQELAKLGFSGADYETGKLLGVISFRDQTLL